MEALAGEPITEDDLANFVAQAGLSEDPTHAREHPNWDQWLTHRMALSWSYEDTSTRSAEELRRIDCPVLLIKGDQTEAWLARVADALGERLPEARVVELEGGHAAHIQSIDRFLEELEAHLHRAEQGQPSGRG